MSFLDVIIIGLASWRLASLLVNEEGPGLIFMRLRTLVGVVEGPGEQSSGFLPLVFSCIWCMSVWTTIAATIAWYFSHEAVMLAAAMAIAVLAESFVRGQYHDNVR